MAKKSEVRIAPYVSAKTFGRFIQRFVDAGGKLPVRIDRSVLGGLSGSNQSAVLGALEFLGLIQPDGSVTESFRELLTDASADGEGIRSDYLSDIVATAYEPVVGELELSTATGKMLEERFRENGGVDGHTLIKAIRFYLKLAKDAGLTVSPHIKLRTPPPAKRKAGANTATEKNVDETDADESDDGKGRNVDPLGHSLPDGIHPMIAGLVQSLPEPSSAMTEGDRQNLERGFGMALRIAYKVTTKEEEAE